MLASVPDKKAKKLVPKSEEHRGRRWGGTYEDAGAEGEGGLEAKARGVIAALAQARGHPSS